MKKFLCFSFILASAICMGSKDVSFEYDAAGNRTRGHEHLTNFGVINMNARLYDPFMGRFLSPDPYVQDPQNTQSLNRYAYCLNNPLKYTDPSGEIFMEIVCGFFKGVVEWFKGGKWYSPFKFMAKNLENEFKLYGGLFQGNIGQIISRFTKELPQTFIGLAYSRFRSVKENTFGRGVNIKYFKGATFIDGVGENSGVTLGSYINIWEPRKSLEVTNDSKYGITGDNIGLYMHEYGHYIQSQTFGLFYLPVFGVPSLISAAGKGNHKKFFTETFANRLSFSFFGFSSEDEWDRVTTPPNKMPYYLHK